MMFGLVLMCNLSLYVSQSGPTGRGSRQSIIVSWNNEEEKEPFRAGPETATSSLSCFDEIYNWANASDLH